MYPRLSILLLEDPPQEVCELVILHQLLELALHLLAGEIQLLFLCLVIVDALLAVHDLLLHPADLGFYELHRRVACVSVVVDDSLSVSTAADQQNISVSC